MNAIKKRTLAVNAATEEVKNHPCCAQLVECTYYYTVHLPYGFAVDGVRADKKAGKANSLRFILKALEDQWKRSIL